MPNHDYEHVECRVYVTDYYVPCTIGATKGAPRCTVCGGTLRWIPQIGRMDYGPAGGAGFKSFTIEEEVRGRSQRIDIDSVSKLRKVEREFEVHARNGEARPLVWRDYAQTKSNQDVHTLSTQIGDPHNVAPEITRVVGKKVTASRGEAVTRKHGTL